MTALEPYSPPRTDAQNRWLDLVSPAAALAKEIAMTEFVPDSMRGKPAAISACILYGAEIGIGPMQSLAKVDIVKGRPAPRAELGRALALAAGHEVWVDEATNTRAKVCGRRRGSDNIQSVTWTLDDVKRAGISSPMYQKYPRQMLVARASAELVRQMCPDALGGISLFAEEAEAEAADVAAQPAEPQKATATTRKRSTPPQAALPPAATDEADTPSGPPTPEQIKKMMASFNDLGIKAREDRLGFIAVAVRPVESSNELTVDEASTVIDTLERVTAGMLRIEATPGGGIVLVVPDDELPLLPGEEG